MISIIVPVYNVEMYLERCVQSLRQQIYTEIEIILINDGSTDGSGALCDAYAKQDNRIVVIHQENQGLSAARNAGIKQAKYPYLGFVDSDDWVSLDMFEYIHSLIETYHPDVVDVAYLKSSRTEMTVPKGIPEKVEVLSGVDILHDYLNKGDYSVWKKVYHKSCFENIKFPVGKLFEDITTNYKILQEAKTVAVSNKVCYYYFINEGSITQQGFRMKDLDLLEMSEELLALTMKSQDLVQIEAAKVRRARSYFSLLAKISRFGFKETNVDRKKIVKELTNKLRSEMKLLLTTPTVPINRKIMIVLMSIHYQLVAFPIHCITVLKK